MDRKEVFQVISNEREFQQRNIENPERPDMIEDLHVGDSITAIRHNLELAQEAWYVGAVPHTQAMHFLRKIAALCVAAGEKYEMPLR